jgi:hypothetical protein
LPQAKGVLLLLLLLLLVWPSSLARLSSSAVLFGGGGSSRSWRARCLSWRSVRSHSVGHLYLYQGSSKARLRLY